jgi:hypothetical protein
MDEHIESKNPQPWLAGCHTLASKNLDNMQTAQHGGKAFGANLLFASPSVMVHRLRN